MQSIDLYIQANVLMAWLVLIVSFVVLFKCAELFVDNSVALANRLRVPKLVIGIVLVSLATTAPELSVSLIAALRGSPEMALGNAIGSVICDDGLALALAGVVTLSPIAVIPSVLKSSGIFLIIISILTFSFVAFDNTLNRYEGVILVILFACYMTYLYRQHKNSKPEDETGDIEKTSPVKLFAMFALALGGIILASEFVITSATAIARSFNVSEGVIALTMVAFGTSVPEVATCITASRKGEGSIAVGNILGADIMNICWVAGASSIANSLTLSKKDIFFMFPAMFIIIATMLFLLRKGYCLTRGKGLILFSLYIIYLASFFYFFKPQF